MRDGYSPTLPTMGTTESGGDDFVQLVIGNKNFSPWSMRPWALLTHYSLKFEELRIPLFVDGYQQELQKYSPSLKVPVLIDAEPTVWDSLAICEYLSEQYLDGKAWPASRQKRALARSYCAEMHSGFMAIRNHLPMNCRARRRVELDSTVLGECQRIDTLWADARERYGSQGDYLFGGFSIADCMYAPMAMRFHTYGVKLSSLSQQYLEILLKNPAVNQWRSEAESEAESLPDFEFGDEIQD